MNLNRRFIIVFVGFMIGIILGCASSGRRQRHALNLPPGLDSTTVVSADKIAQRSFVSAARERKAEQLANEGRSNLNQVDEFWAYLEKDFKEKKGLSVEEKTQFDREYARGVQLLNRWKDLAKNGADDNMAEQALAQCLQAQAHLEQAIRINPFDKNARFLLSITYYNLQYLFGLQNNYPRAVEILERLTRIEKGEHDLFRLLGENYLALKKFDLALVNFQEALKVLIQTSYETPPDTSQMFNYAYCQGDAFARMYDKDNAINAFQIASTLARTPQEKTDVDNYLKWIDWDAGNIKASEVWDKILALEAGKDFTQMVDVCKKLLPYLKTQKAKIQVHHKIAVVEFEILSKKDQAIERMLHVYETLPREITSSNDSELKSIFETYGAMLYRLGVEAIEKDEKRIALAYLTKSVSFPWEQAAKAHIELVTLLWNDPNKAIFHGKKALEDANKLTEKESCELLSLMVKAHKSAGLYDEAREYFNKWKQCKRIL